MDTFTDIIFVRHGETAGNLGGLLQGRGSSSLSENGILQAEAAAEELADIPFTFACSSDQVRAVETSEIILKKHPGIVLETTPALEEWNVGIYEGRRQDELLREYPDEMDHFIRERGEFPVPGGESRDEFQKRVSDYLNDVVERNRGGVILLVSHGWTGNRILCHFYGPPKPGMILPTVNNASISRFRWCHEKNTCRMVCWNSSAHLKHLSVRRNPVD